MGPLFHVVPNFEPPNRFTLRAGCAPFSRLPTLNR